MSCLPPISNVTYRAVVMGGHGLTEGERRQWAWGKFKEFVAKQDAPPDEQAFILEDVPVVDQRTDR